MPARGSCPSPARQPRPSPSRRPAPFPRHSHPSRPGRTEGRHAPARPTPRAAPGRSSGWPDRPDRCTPTASRRWCRRAGTSVGESATAGRSTPAPVRLGQFPADHPEPAHNGGWNVRDVAHLYPPRPSSPPGRTSAHQSLRGWRGRADVIGVSGPATPATPPGTGDNTLGTRWEDAPAPSGTGPRSAASRRCPDPREGAPIARKDPSITREDPRRGPGVVGPTGTQVLRSCRNSSNLSAARGSDPRWDTSVRGRASHLLVQILGDAAVAHRQVHGAQGAQSCRRGHSNQAMLRT